jgi:hypothetical protein
MRVRDEPDGKRILKKMAKKLVAVVGVEPTTPRI